MDSPHALGGSLGEVLRRAREARGVTLEAVAHETKIPRRHLEALERDDLDALPGSFYQRAEIRAYARAVGLDDGQALALLESRLRAEAPPEPGPDRVAPDTAGQKRPLVLVGLGLAVVVFLVARLLFTGAPAAAPGGDTPDGEGFPAAAEVFPADPVPSADTPRGTAPPSRESSEVAPASSLPFAVRPDASADVLAASDEQVLPPPSEIREPAPGVAEEAGVTELVVTTDPAGAQVTVNGIGWGASPVAIRHLAPGVHRIRVSKDRYVSEERTLRVAAGRRHAVEIPLTSAP